MRVNITHLALIAGSVLFAPAAQAVSWDVDTSRSSISFSYLEGESAREGRFKTFEAELTFDPAQLDKSEARISIATASLDLSDDLREGVLATLPWLASEDYPSARFDLTDISGSAAEGFSANGVLQIKDVRQAISFPLEFEAVDNLATARGKFSFSRLDFGLRDVFVESFVRIGETIDIEFLLVATHDAEAGE